MPAHSSHQFAGAQHTLTNGNWFHLWSDATSIGENEDISSILATEIVGNDGYTSPNFVYSAPVWDAVNSRNSISMTPFDYGNGGTTTIQYQSMVAVCCSSGHTRIIPQAVTQSSFDGGADTVTITAHGYVDDDPILFRVESGTLDTALSANFKYTVLNATANTFQVSVDQVNPINLNGDGAALTAYVIDRDVDEDQGGLVYKVFPTVTSIAPGQSVNVQWPSSYDTVIS